ncbi:MAG TPA: ABC transporter permease [Pseudolysinimonas sp.]|jgi:hypothetical protein
MSAQTVPVAPLTPWRRAIGVSVGLAAVIVVVVLAFIWPNVTASAKNVPIVVAGPSATTAPLVSQLTTATDGAFAIDTVATRADAVKLIKERKAYGAIVVEGTAPEVLTASAANAAISQSLGTLATQLQTQLQAGADAQAAAAGITAPTITVKVTDVVPLASTDPRGIGITSAAFPLVLGGMIGGVGLTLSIRGAARRLLGVTVYAVVGGLALSAILGSWLGLVLGNYFVLAGAFALAIAGISATIVGAAAVIGSAGLAVGPVLFLLFANPISSAATPKEFLTGPWGDIGQWFPPGAGVTLLRDISYFPDANATFPWLVLVGWTVLGYLLGALGHFRNRNAALVSEDRVEEEEAALGTSPAAGLPA